MFHACLCVNVLSLPPWFTCLRVIVVYVPTCQERVNFSFLRANMPWPVHNVSSWRAKVPNRVPIFELGVSTCQRAFSKHSSLRYYYIRNSIIYVIWQLCISYVYVSYIKIALYFISILHFILKRNAEFFFFIIFFLFS